MASSFDVEAPDLQNAPCPRYESIRTADPRVRRSSKTRPSAPMSRTFFDPRSTDEGLPLLYVSLTRGRPPRDEVVSSSCPGLRGEGHNLEVLKPPSRTSEGAMLLISRSTPYDGLGSLLTVLEFESRPESSLRSPTSHPGP